MRKQRAYTTHTRTNWRLRLSFVKKLFLKVNFLNGYVTTKARQFHESIAMSRPISKHSPIIETPDQKTVPSDSSTSSKDTQPKSQAPQLLNKRKTTDPDTDRSSYTAENSSSTISSVDTPNEQQEEMERRFKDLSISNGQKKAPEINASQHDDIAKDPEYLFNVGLSYYEGEEDGDNQNSTKAFFYLSMAAAQGHANAQYNLGVMYWHGNGIAKDLTKAAEWMLKAAAQGKMDAQFNLGVMYEYGEGVVQDSSKAAEWYLKAAIKEHSLAQYRIGAMFYVGHGVDKDFREAANWFEKAANQGHIAAQVNIGSLYNEGKGVIKDLSKGANWYERAANQGHADAQFHLGFMYENGDGIDQNLSKAAEWYKKAADQEHSDAQFYLGLMYENGDGLGKDLSKAAEWCIKAAEKGHSDAQFNLGLMYYRENGLGKDLSKAAHFFQMAAERGQNDAQINLGVMYYTGDGLGKDLSKAAHFFQMAAEGGSRKAQLAVAELIIFNDKDNRDLYKAAYWLLRSGLSDDKKTIKISLEGFSDLIALIPSALFESKEFVKVKSIEFLKIPVEARGRMGPIFAELMRSNPNLTSLKAPNYVIDEDEAHLIKKSLEINTGFNEVNLDYTQLDTPKNSYEKAKKMFWNSLPQFFNFEKSIKTQLLETTKINQTIFELRQYLQKRREEIENRSLPFFDAIPWDVLMEIGNEIIIRSLKSGFSKEATLIALDEFLLSVHADGIRKNKTITNS